jgi:hypothetical protein
MAMLVEEEKDARKNGWVNAWRGEIEAVEFQPTRRGVARLLDGLISELCANEG